MNGAERTEHAQPSRWAVHAQIRPDQPEVRMHSLAGTWEIFFPCGPGHWSLKGWGPLAYDIYHIATRGRWKWINVSAVLNKEGICILKWAFLICGVSTWGCQHHISEGLLMQPEATSGRCSEVRKVYGVDFLVIRRLSWISEGCNWKLWPWTGNDF